MANGSVYDKIIALGKEDAENIIKEGQNKANNITEQVINLTNEKIEQMISDAKAKNAEKVKAQIAVLEQKKKQVMLANQKRIIKETFDKVLDRLCQMNDEELKSFVKTYLEKSGLKEDIIIKVSEKEYNRYVKLFSSNNSQELDKLSNAYGHKVNLSNEKVNITGGFIIEGSYFDIDNSYEVILNNLVDSLETKVAEMLFRNEG